MLGRGNVAADRGNGHRRAPSQQQVEQEQRIVAEVLQVAQEADAQDAAVEAARNEADAEV